MRYTHRDITLRAGCCAVSIMLRPVFDRFAERVRRPQSNLRRAPSRLLLRRLPPREPLPLSLRCRVSTVVTVYRVQPSRRSRISSQSCVCVPRWLGSRPSRPCRAWCCGLLACRPPSRLLSSAIMSMCRALSAIASDLDPLPCAAVCRVSLVSLLNTPQRYAFFSNYQIFFAK